MISSDDCQGAGKEVETARHGRGRGGTEARSNYFNARRSLDLQILIVSRDPWAVFRPKTVGMPNAPTGRMDHDHAVSDRVIHAGIAVHRHLGPGLLESAYLTSLCVELAHLGLKFDRERRIPLEYRGVCVGEYIPDLIVENTLVVEVKSVSHLEPVFTAQLLTYLRITGLHVGLLLNFNSAKLIDGFSAPPWPTSVRRLSPQDPALVSEINR